MVAAAVIRQTLTLLAICTPAFKHIVFGFSETPPDALILESPFTNIREEARSHPFSVASIQWLSDMWHVIVCLEVNHQK